MSEHNRMSFVTFAPLIASAIAIGGVIASYAKISVRVEKNEIIAERVRILEIESAGNKQILLGIKESVEKIERKLDRRSG